MFWRLECLDPDPEPPVQNGARFVLQRHHDARGAHLDLRLEAGGVLTGWRIEGGALEGVLWATLKPPHPARWLDYEGGAARLEAGDYVWVSDENGARVLRLQGRAGAWRLRVAPWEPMTGAEARALAEAVEACGASWAEAASLVRDGAAARSRAIERLCGLGRELDGDTFDDGAWRRLLGGMALPEIQAHLRAYEVRFDGKYPPAPVSRPEPLPDVASETRTGTALAIAKE